MESNVLEKNLKKYKLDSLLLVIASEARKMYKDGVWKRDIRWTRKIGPYDEVFDQILPIWSLFELAYRAIKNSTDYRHKEPNNQDLYSLNNLLAQVSDQQYKQKSKDMTKQQIEANIFLGLPQTQFWWQDIVQRRRGDIVYNFIRYYLLLSEIPKLYPHDRSPNDTLIELTGFSIKEFSQLMFAIYGWTVTTPVLDINLLNNIHETITKKNEIITLENINKCLEYFTGKYSYYRQDFENNPLYFKPIIKTETQKLIVSNTFVWAKKLYEGIYWIIRDKYKRDSSQEFTNAFGHYYERYIEMLLSFYLPEDMFDKIEEEGQADWIIYTDKYILLIEQKSSLMSIQLKSKYPAIKQLQKYLKILNKACLQLKNTQQCFKGEKRIVVKLILHFEKFYFQKTIKDKLTLEVEDNNIMERLFLIDTEEFERLIQELSQRPKNFESIIDEKIKFEHDPPPSQYGQDFHHILTQRHLWKELEFLEHHKNFFDNLVKYQ